MRVMKGQLILFNAISVVAYLLWIGWKLFAAFARAMGSSSAQGPETGFVMVVVGIAAAVCVAVSFFAPPSFAKFIALAPLALILLGEGVMSYQKDAYYKRRASERAALRSAREKKLSGISKDYVYKDGMGGAPGDSKSSFLTHDKEFHTIVRIDVSYESQMDVFPIGRINGEHLETLERPQDMAQFYKRYVDSEGKTIYDRYTLKHAPDQDKNFHLEKYER
jgi:hypothetical protein